MLRGVNHVRGRLRARGRRGTDKILAAVRLAQPCNGASARPRLPVVAHRPGFGIWTYFALPRRNRRCWIAMPPVDRWRWSCSGSAAACRWSRWRHSLPQASHSPNFAARWSPRRCCVHHAGGAGHGQRRRRRARGHGAGSSSLTPEAIEGLGAGKRQRASLVIAIEEWHSPGRQPRRRQGAALALAVTPVQPGGLRLWPQACGSRASAAPAG